MPTQKDLKRLVRRRMQKTGESYTAARAHLVKARPSRSTNGTPATAAPVKPATAARAKPADYAKLAGMSDAAVKAATGCDWKRWVDALDYVEAHTWPHRKIADYVQEKFKVRDWWTQTVVVGYERIRGLREIGQRRGGSYEATKSRTFAVPVAKLFQAFAEARPRARWLPGVKLTVRKATPHRSVRITWDDGTSVEVWLTAKGGKSSAQVAHRKLPSREAAAKTKAFWDERLDALAEYLTP
ncbi:MAG TPA: hypothetical protein VJY35_07525 [Candidatus Eisenbacteria bacterium]|nr:hypothetical protein [Candidatus Eisenbacteria bacterium]